MDVVAYFTMTEKEYVAKCEGYRRKRWLEDRATMFVAFMIQKMEAEKPEDDFEKFYPPLDQKVQDLPTDEEIDKMFSECL